MKIQYLAVIFIIIILPISLILSSYEKNMIQTLNLQISYDSKLKNATYDAIKAYQLNASNSDTSDLANSKTRDIEASANTFFNSMASNFNMSGYNQNVLKNYVPALVYTMYDGYYIYSCYDNVIESTDAVSEGDNKSTYQKNEKIYGLKPYVYYSCQYIKGNINVVISYSLDNYIEVKGTVNGDPISLSGYLLSGVEKTGNNYKYNGVTIPQNETDITENLIYFDKDPEPTIPKQYSTRKINGVKYYQDGNNIFSILNGRKIDNQGQFEVMDNDGNKTINTINVTNNNNAYLYYKEAFNLRQDLDKYGLLDLKVGDAVDEIRKKPSDDDSQLKDWNGNANDKIFDYTDDSTNGIESSNSLFNQHRLAVIRYSIEKNLSVAISNYNNYSGVTTDFQMPKLKETDWDQIYNNVTMISFMQGLSIGGKVYNGYSIVPNTKNSEIVTEDSIYIIDKSYIYHKVTDTTLKEPKIGVYNIDLEKSTTVTSDAQTVYFFPKLLDENYTASYTSIVTSSSNVNTDNINAYLTNLINSRKI